MKLYTIFIITFLIGNVFTENKYTRSANENKKIDVDFRTLEKPFRMNKLNLLWTKAIQRLPEPKLRSLYSDLMIQDKAEITYKRVKSEGVDKEGLKEAELRRKLTNIMQSYGLRHHFENVPVSKQNEHAAYNSAMDEIILNKSLFKDKKLNMLWAKAEASGFTNEELSALKEEFMHHQDKIDQYYDLLVNIDVEDSEAYKNAVNDEEIEQFNEINYEKDNGENLSRNFVDKANLVREKHRGLRDGYDRLQRVAARGPTNREFIEPKVQGLWKIAAAANFTVDELSSLKVELQHYENRLLKLRTLHADHVSNLGKHHSKSRYDPPMINDTQVAAAGDKMDYFADQQQMIKKHTLKVEKLHQDIESKIMGRHTEL